MTDNNTIVGLTLRAANGVEQRVLAWFPTAAVRKDFYNKAEKRGITIVDVTPNVKSR